MITFVVHYVTPALFSQGFRSHEWRVDGAVNTYRLMCELRKMRLPVLAMWVTIE